LEIKKSLLFLILNLPKKFLFFDSFFRVAVIGTGGNGNEVIRCLSMLGVGSFKG
jgi:hypothetical protein